jgi:hypothetical protein
MNAPCGASGPQVYRPLLTIPCRKLRCTKQLKLGQLTGHCGRKPVCILLSLWAQIDRELTFGVAVLCANLGQEAYLAGLDL